MLNFIFWELLNSDKIVIILCFFLDTQLKQNLLPSFDVYESQPLRYSDEFSSSSKESLRGKSFVIKTKFKLLKSYVKSLYGFLETDYIENNRERLIVIKLL